MPVDRATGHPDFSSSGDTKYIVEMYYKNFLEQWYNNTILEKVTTSKYNEQITQMGDTVNVRTYANPTIFDVAKGQQVTYENLTSNSTSLAIDHAKAFAVKIDKIDKKQFDLDAMQQWNEGGVETMKVHIEQHVFSTIPDQAHASNIGATAGLVSSRYNMGASGAPVTLSPQNIVDYLTYMHGILNEQNAPKGAGVRYVILPSWACVMLLRSDLGNAQFSGDDQTIIRNPDMIGNIAGFTVYDSNNLETVTDGADTVTNIIFGHKEAVGFAEQIVDYEYIERLENTFGSAMRSLKVYGFNTIKTEGLGILYARPAA